MVNPLLLIAIYLLAAFLVALADKAHRKAALALLYLTLGTGLVLSLWQVWQLRLDPDAGTTVFTAGFPAPLSIALAFGLPEALLLSLLNGIGLLGAVFLHRKLAEGGAQGLALYLLVLLGAAGLVLTRDVFNSFVFLEILSIATYSLLGLKQSGSSLASGFKYMLAGGIASSLYLIGIAMAYRYTGTLNLDTWAALGQVPGAGYRVALYLVAIGLFLELKPWPANGWALDLYQASNSGVSALIASVHTGAALYLFYKLLPLFSYDLLNLLTAAGLVSFVLANLVALRQSDARRLLGYSSTAQAGLVVFALGATRMLGLHASAQLLIAGGLFATNALAKSGLFWLSGIVRAKLVADWGRLRRESGLLILFFIFVLALLCIPPFPGFFAKWSLVRALVSGQAWLWLGALLAGSLLEAAYLLRWAGWVARGEGEGDLELARSRIAAPLVSGVLLCVAGVLAALYRFNGDPLILLPVFALLVLGLLDFLPAKAKGIIALLLVAGYGWRYLLPVARGLTGLFALALVGGAAVQIFAFMHRKGRAEGIFPLLTALILSLGNLLLAGSRLEFFLAWELMTFTSYLLALRGGQARVPAYVYALFSSAGAYCLLAGLNLVQEFGVWGGQAVIWSAAAKLGAALLALGFLVKTGACGLHYWLPGVYAESEDDTSSIFSSVLSKAGIYGLILLLAMLLPQISNSAWSLQALGWLGLLTAFFGALMAVFQEDAKLLLAYSSMSQLGYIVAGLALMSHLGWVSALYLTVTHVLFKGLIFLAMAGVFLRTGTRQMYEMGGLIKKMPISYISVLMGIIAVSGVPPLTGFGSKWFIYTSLLESGQPLQAALAFFASAVAFLYLYKLIHTVFLGQPKPEHKQVREAPVWLLIPQGIFIAAIMAFSMFPNLLTKPLSAIVGQYIAKPDWLSWSGYTIQMNSPRLQGYWNGNLVMLVTFGVFAVPLIWLLLVNSRPKKVKQFNIVYAAERPYKPGTTHFAYNMFAHYNKALGWLVRPRVTAFYQGLAEWTRSLAATLSRLYTGNGQTYLLHLFLYAVALYLMLGVK